LQPIAQGVGTALVGAFKALVPVVQGAWTVVAGVARVMASHAGAVKAFALAATAVFLAFKGYQILVAAGLALRTFALTVESALGPIGLIVAGVTAVAGLFLTLGGNASKSSADVQTFTDAIKADSGALAENTRQAVVNALEKQGALAAGLKLGLTTHTLTDATLGNASAMQAVNDALAATRTHLEANHTAVSSAHVYIKGAIDDGSKLGAAYKTVSEAVNNTTGEIHSAVAAYQRTSSAMKTTAAAVAATAGTLHVQTNAAYLDASAQSRLRDASDNLKDAQKALNGVLSATTRALSNAAAAVAWQQSLNDLTQTVKTNKGAITGHTDAALADKAALIQNMQTIDDHANQMHKSGKSWQDVTGYITKQYGELRQHATNAGIDAGAVDDLAKKVKLFPPDIKRKIDVDTAAASAALDNFRAAQASASIRVPVTTYFAGGFQVGNMHTGIGARAAGGPIVGPGGPTADRVPIMASNGEHVLTADEVQQAGGQGAVYRMRRLIRSGALKFARGGAVSSLMSVIRQAGFSGSAADVMYGIVEAESGGNRFAHNTNSSTGDNSYGLAQINMIGSMGPARRAQFHLASNNALFDPLTNLRVAYSLSSHGRNFSPWTTFTSGAYRQYLGGGQNATVAALASPWRTSAARRCGSTAGRTTRRCRRRRTRRRGRVVGVERGGVPRRTSGRTRCRGSTRCWAVSAAPRTARRSTWARRVSGWWSGRSRRRGASWRACRG
jgi:hypothetical protein